MATSHQRRGRRRISVGIAAAVAAGVVGATVALPAHANEAAAEGTIVGSSAAEAVEGSYLVTLKQGRMQAGSADAKSLMSKYDGKVTTTFKTVLNGYAAEMSESDAKKLAADPAVEMVHQNQKHTTTAVQEDPPSWGLDRIDAERGTDRSYSYPDHAGAGSTVYVIDTGIQITHDDFGGRASHGYDSIDDDFDATDGNGHGTHVASTAAGTAHGVAKEADIVGVRVLNDEGQGDTVSVVKGVEWVTENAGSGSVVNMSLGGPDDKVVDEAVRNSIATGIPYSLAAGNDRGDTADFSPARVETGITVASSSRLNLRSFFSNSGELVDIFAPGSGIKGAWIGENDATKSASGTSMAAPHVAGAIALHLAEHPDASPEEVATALDENATADAIHFPPANTTDKLLRIVE